MINEKKNCLYTVVFKIRSAQLNAIRVALSNLQILKLFVYNSHCCYHTIRLYLRFLWTFNPLKNGLFLKGAIYPGGIIQIPMQYGYQR